MDMNYIFSERVTEEKEQLAAEYKEQIIDLYVNQRMAVHKIAEIISIKRLNHVTIKRYLQKWNVPIRFQNGQHEQDKFINYIGVYKADKLIKVFMYKYEVRQWIVDNQLLDTKISHWKLNDLIKQNQQLKGYIFNHISEELFHKHLNA
ncbi:hypothetical protein [Niallia taxi]|uniref:hypothetical protein n=1 Tax=Niallia taxi TaxID=2499688 RepID=UPI0015F47D28|nr:hypothetical protein [Niallia taxi]